jgi:hypothetical protein
VVIGAAWVGLGAVALFYIGGMVMNGLVRGIVLLPRAIVWWFNAVQEGADFWSIAGRVAAALARALATSQIAWWVVAFELVGVAALYGLQWLMRNEERRGRSEEVKK